MPQISNLCLIGPYHVGSVDGCNQKDCPYKKYKLVMEEIKKAQGDMAAVVILQSEDGGTVYLRHNITEEQTADMLMQASN